MRVTAAGVAATLADTTFVFAFSFSVVATHAELTLSTDLLTLALAAAVRTSFSFSSGRCTQLGSFAYAADAAVVSNNRV